MMLTSIEAYHLKSVLELLSDMGLSKKQLMLRLVGGALDRYGVKVVDFP